MYTFFCVTFNHRLCELLTIKMYMYFGQTFMIFCGFSYYHYSQRIDIFNVLIYINLLTCVHSTMYQTLVCFD